jgi:RNA polymerase sigma factor (sigma-70 family)
VVVEAPGGTRGVGEVDEPLAAPRCDGAWVVLYRRWYGPMVRLAGLLVGDYRVGEEVAQDAFARLFETGPAVTSPVAYLRATVVNLCRSQIRRAVIARRLPPLVPGVVLGPEERTDELAPRAAVRQALGRLSRRQREAVVLRYYAELSEAETAAAMGVSAGSVKRHLHLARAALSSDLEGMR